MFVLRFNRPTVDAWLPELWLPMHHREAVRTSPYPLARQPCIRTKGKSTPEISDNRVVSPRGLVYLWSQQSIL